MSDTPRTVEPLVRLCYRLGRHLLNPDNIPLPTWARIGCEMLAELRDINPNKYAEAMKPNVPDQRAANSGTLNPVVGKG